MLTELDGAFEMLIASGLSADWGGLLASVARTVKLEFPTVVGVPAMAPLPLVRVSPGGNEPADTLQV
jgi:hypothetical protein